MIDVLRFGFGKKELVKMTPEERTRDLENPSASVHLKRFSTPSLTLKFLCAGKLNPRTKTPNASISTPAIRSAIMSSVVVQWPVRMIAAPVITSKAPKTFSPRAMITGSLLAPSTLLLPVRLRERGAARGRRELRFLQPEDRLAAGEGDPHALPDRVQVFPGERENVGQEGRDATSRGSFFNLLTAMLGLSNSRPCEFRRYRATVCPPLRIRV